MLSVASRWRIKETLLTIKSDPTSLFVERFHQHLRCMQMAHGVSPSSVYCCAANIPDPSGGCQAMGAIFLDFSRVDRGAFEKIRLHSVEAVCGRCGPCAGGCRCYFLSYFLFVLMLIRLQQRALRLESLQGIPDGFDPQLIEWRMGCWILPDLGIRSQALFGMGA